MRGQSQTLYGAENAREGHMADLRGMDTHGDVFSRRILDVPRTADGRNKGHGHAQGRRHAFVCAGEWEADARRLR